MHISKFSVNRLLEFNLQNIVQFGEKKIARSRNSTSCDFGGDPGGARTHDPMIKSHLLSSVSKSFATLIFQRQPTEPQSQNLYAITARYISFYFGLNLSLNRMYLLINVYCTHRE